MDRPPPGGRFATKPAGAATAPASWATIRSVAGAERTRLVDAVSQALAQDPPDWSRATDAWLDLSLACKETPQESAAQALGHALRMRDRGFAETLLARLKRE